jgi:predicted MFS family arabinose efflux permease
MPPDCSACLEPGAIPPPAETSGDARWLAVASLGLGVFALVTAEFLPASLLTAMANDLHVSDGAAARR